MATSNARVDPTTGESTPAASASLYQLIMKQHKLPPAKSAKRHVKALADSMFVIAG